MKIVKTIRSGFIAFLLFIFLIINPSGLINAQDKITFGVHADPVICWFGSDMKNIKNDGARPGFNFGINYNKYFAPNYSFSTGISIISTGGTLISSDTYVMEFTNFDSTVLPGEQVIYKIQYLSIPLGLKLQTNQIGYITFFTDLGLDPKCVIGGKADIPSLNITGEKALNELGWFNLSYHISAGIEYSIGGNTAMVLGLNFENNFLDITEDNGTQLNDKVTHKLMSFRIGIIF